MALDTFTPTAFRLIAQGCEATLGKETPQPNYAEGVAPILGGEDIMLQNYVGTIVAAILDLVMTEHLWRSICICDLRFPG